MKNNFIMSCLRSISNIKRKLLQTTLFVTMKLNLYVKPGTNFNPALVILSPSMKNIS